ncbi:dehydrogenase/reductase SDR family member 1 [Trichechus manatus latirostris]|uniref:Dehydrogenase/reductase SDR family member 1 n=1 Tax=Trichechus manatus latirostris TaxID=127582 RepID=A0A2Y9QI46_TRIMA|nr:dehydrogenase/reductase SDR family member 1 [Trichechus manatus latirostris]
MAGPMKGQVCVVTGASRGIARGIALQLSQAGATVYITGRHLDTLQATAQEAQSCGGRCVPVVCDSSQESEVQSLFEQVDREQHWRLDMLAILNNKKNAFWESPAFPDDINNVGLRLAADCARELHRHGVRYVSLWPGLVQTELLKEHMAKENTTEDPLLKQFRPIFSSAETTELSGKCIVALATGRPVQDYLSVSSVLTHVSSLGWLASYLPGFLRMPKWIMTLYASKF